MFAADYFEEYARILDFLIAESWGFVLPAEYAAALQQAQKRVPSLAKGRLPD